MRVFIVYRMVIYVVSFDTATQIRDQTALKLTLCSLTDDCLILLQFRKQETWAAIRQS